MVFASHVHIDERVINIDTAHTCLYIYINTGERISRARSRARLHPRARGWRGAMNDSVKARCVA